MNFSIRHLSGRRVFAGLSGGVDSAVTAMLLQKAGAEVTGVFIKGWYPPNLSCTWASDRRDAMQVAAALHIPFVTLDASHAYKKAVIDYLIEEYGAGRTPNPDIMCNREIKFGVFHRYAKERGAHHIATGHYARTKDGRLYRGIDADKDQSYFLWAVPTPALHDTVFPLGDFYKKEVRSRAQRLQLPVATKKDSQGICFLGNISVDEFLRTELGTEPGAACDENGENVGMHDGAVLYTLGERIALSNAPSGPWYVMQKKLTKNVLIVSKNRKQKNMLLPIHIKDIHWFLQPPSGSVEAQYRYHGPRIIGHYHDETKSFVPDAPLPEPMSSGQSLVLYQNDECLGGGIII